MVGQLTWISPDRFFRLIAGVTLGMPKISQYLSLGKHSANYIALGLDTGKSQKNQPKRKVQQVHARANHGRAKILKKVTTCKDPPGHEMLMYIVHGKDILMEKDERGTFWLPYTWYNLETDTNVQAALKNTLKNRQFDCTGVRATNLGTSKHAGGKQVTHFALDVQNVYLGNLWVGSEWKSVRDLFFSLLDQQKYPLKCTKIELQYDTIHMGKIGMRHLRSKIQDAGDGPMQMSQHQHAELADDLSQHSTHTPHHSPQWYDITWKK